MHGCAPAIDCAGNKAHRQPIRNRRPLKHLNIVGISAAVIGKIDSGTVSTDHRAKLPGRRETPGCPTMRGKLPQWPRHLRSYWERHPRESRLQPYLDVNDSMPTLATMFRDFDRVQSPISYPQAEIRQQTIAGCDVETHVCRKQRRLAQIG